MSAQPQPPSPQRTTAHPAFEFVRSHRIDSLNVEVSEYRHRVTGARHFHLAADDDNNAFLVAFLTVPKDSTGVAHILEHTSLCGSKRFPVRDPFFMMIRRSLNTFMNAMTASDWTTYPFASRNRKDFYNLLDVYLDAVFFPRLDSLDFAQEGHRVEFETPDDPSTPLVFKGVVFNEMKGAMSAPTSQLWQEMQAELFPTVTYHYNSGGDPARIPDLSYQQLKDFHARHYHPSNAVFMTYGDLPVEQHQAMFEDKALAAFQRLDMDLAVPDERRYPEPRTVDASYALEGEDDLSRKTHVVIGWLLGHNTDLEALLTSHLLSGVLLDNGSCPLLQALETTKLGTAPSPLCGLEDSSREMMFVCGVEGSDLEHAAAVEELVLGVLRDVAENGIPQEQVESILHQFELHQREISGGHFPYGLNLMLKGLATTLHGGDLVAMLDIDPQLEALRERIQDPEYIKGLVRSLLLDNPHRVRLAMEPDAELNALRLDAEKERLAAMKAGMDAQKKAEVVELAKRLEQRQNTQDDPGVLPKVGIEDVPVDLHIATGETTEVAGMPAAWYAQGTNGMVYQQVAIDLPALDSAQFRDLSLLTDCLGEVGVGDADYIATQARMAATTGGIGSRFSLRSDVDDLQGGRGLFVVSGKALVRNRDPLASLVRETLLESRFDELPRIRELIAQDRAGREAAVTGHGHALAMSAACAGFNQVGRISHEVSGLLGIRRLKALDDGLNKDGELEAFGQRLADLAATLAAAPRQLLLVGEQQHRSTMLDGVAQVWDGITSSASGDGRLQPEPGSGRVLEGWATNSQVRFCAKAYPTVAANHPDAPALMVLGGFLRNGFLHRAIREQGGAYGGGASYDGDTGGFRFYSYRDPRLTGTLDDFDRAIGWLATTDHEPRAMEEAILGVIGAIDKPSTPAAEAIGAFHSSLHGRTPEQRRAFRQRVLAVSLDDLKRVGETWLIPEQASIAVVGDADTLEREGAALGLSIEEL